MEFQAFENVAPISPSFVAQNLTHNFTTPSLGLTQTSTPSLATSLAKDFNLTLPIESITLVGTLDTHPPSQTTTWTPTFGAPPIHEDAKQPYKPFEVHYSTMTSTY